LPVINRVDVVIAGVGVSCNNDAACMDLAGLAVTTLGAPAGLRMLLAQGWLPFSVQPFRLS